MFHCLLPLLILAADLPAHTASPLTHAEEVRQWDFEEGDDKNYDLWPDDWTRRRGKGYPLYLKIEIADAAAPRDAGQPAAAASQRALRMDLDGGAALVYSPLVEVSPLFSYVLKGRVKTEKLEHDVAYAAVMFYDQNHKLLETHCDERRKSSETAGPPYRGQSGDWESFQIGPVTPASNEVYGAVIALHLEPTAKADLFGSAMFDDLSLVRLPRVSVVTHEPVTRPVPKTLFKSPGAVRITCQVSGISQSDPKVRFELQDVHGQPVDADEMKLDTSRPNADSASAFAGSATWDPAIPEFGFYRVLVSMSGQQGDPIATNIAVLQSFPESDHGEFGWTLPASDNSPALRELVGLLKEAGVHWVKCPVPYGEKDDGRAAKLAEFAERMSAGKINVIGTLDPRAVRDLLDEQERLLEKPSEPPAVALVEPEAVQPAADPAMIRLALKIRWWQLGGDRDTSFVDLRDLEKNFRGIHDGFNRFGQVRLGIPWRFIDEPPASKNPPWSFLSYDADPCLTSEEITQYLPADAPTAAKRWLTLEPLAESHYSLETRVRDLVSRMLAAKIQQADGVFVPAPFDPEHGLMNEDGTPDKLLLPWRTTAMLLADTTYLGSIRMPNGSSNQIFSRGDDAVMVVWNEEPTDEVIYLGQQVHQTDVWGNRRRPSIIDSDGILRQEIKVTRLPTFITGVDPQIALWRKQFQFDDDRIASVFGEEQTVRYSFSNPFNAAVSGTVRLNVPGDWEAVPQSAAFKLSPHERLRQEFRVMLHPSAGSGEQEIEVDFEITPPPDFKSRYNSNSSYKFTVYSTLSVGLGDVLVGLASRLDEHGNLIIEQQLTNTTDEVAGFSCYLTTSQRRRERHQILDLGRGTTTVLYIYPNGKELLGEKFWLRVEEIDGSRILNSQITAQE